VALGLSLATFVLMCAWLFGNDAGSIFDGTRLGTLMAMLAGLSTLLAWLGWWSVNDSLMRTQLILASGVFAGRAAFLFIDSGLNHVAAWLSLCFAVIAGGSYLLEATARDVHG